MRTIRASLRLLALLAIAAVVLASCGGGSDDAGSSGDEESTTTTTTTRPQADEATKALAVAATLQTADFGEGWKEYSPSEVNNPNEKSCGATAAQSALANGASLAGSTAQLGETQAFVSSTSYVFPTEADAVEWVQSAKSDEWAQCWADFFTEFQKEQKTNVTIKLDTREHEVLGQSGVEAYAKFSGTDESGTATAGATDIFVLRSGRIITVMTIETGDISQADLDALNQGQQAALTALYERVTAAS